MQLNSRSTGHTFLIDNDMNGHDQWMDELNAFFHKHIHTNTHIFVLFHSTKSAQLISIARNARSQLNAWNSWITNYYGFWKILPSQNNEYFIVWQTHTFTTHKHTRAHTNTHWAKVNRHWECWFYSRFHYTKFYDHYEYLIECVMHITNVNNSLGMSLKCGVWLL